jgi:hypothetical protein
VGVGAVAVGTVAVGTVAGRHRAWGEQSGGVEASVLASPPRPSLQRKQEKKPPPKAP